MKRMVARLVLLSFYLGLFPWPQGFGPAPAEAKVSPLHSITRQVKKGNMLVVLDTSGSMTGVPGEPFDAATELGVDCDLGDDCREVTQTGQCVIAKQPLSGLPRLCSNDAQCRVGQCKYGTDPCLQDFDCPTVGSVCSKDGKPCQYNSDCSPQMSTCKVSLAACSSVQPCPPAGRCSDGNTVCNNPGGSCPVRYCSDKPTQSCAADADCQVVTPPSNQAPSAGLAAHWKLDDGGGVTVSDSVGSANLTIAGSNAPTWTTGKVNGALNFTASGTISATTGLTGLNGLTTGLTATAWVYRPGDLTGDTHLLELNHTGGRILKLLQGAGNRCFCAEVFQAAGQCACGTLTDNAWQHIGVTWDGANTRLYVNGTAVAGPFPYAGPVSAYTASQAWLGSKSFGGYEVKGKLDDVRIYGQALTPVEMQALHAAGAGSQVGGLIGHWEFSEGTGTTTADSSGVGNTGTLGGGATWTASGKPGSAIDIGWGSYVSVPAQGALANPGQKITYAAWVYPRTCLYQQIFASNGELLPGFRLTNSNNTTPCRLDYGLSSAPSPGYLIASGADIPLNAWSHVAATHDTATQTLKMYLNGNLIGTRTDLGGTIGNPTTLFIGSGPAVPQWHFDGYIDDARIYNKILAANEVQALSGSGLVVHLTFDDNVTDQSGNGFNGVREGGTTYVAGPSGKAISLNGTDGCVSIQSAQGSALDITGPFSVSYFVYREADVATRMVFRRTATTWNQTIAIDTDPVQTNRVNAMLGNANFQLGAAGEVLSAGQWHHVVTTRDGNNFKYYRDGVLAFQTVNSDMATQSNAEPWLLGCRSQGNSHRWDWSAIRMDDFRVYNKALSASEVTALAGTPAAGGGELLGHWKFDEGSGLTVADQSSGNTANLYCTKTDQSQITQNTAECAGTNGLPTWPTGHTGAGSDKSAQIVYNQLAKASGAALDSKLTNQLTVSAWIKKISSTPDRVILHRRRGTDVSDDFKLSMTGLRPDFHINFQSAASPTNIPLNTWVHLVGTYDGTNIRIYVDGVLQGTTSAPGITFPGQAVGNPIVFGAELEGANYQGYLDGHISEAAIWSRALNQAEITTLQAGTLPPPSGGGAFCKPNSCVAQDNSCNVASNICQGGQVNQCLGISSTDSCVINQSNAGPAKMCRFEQTFCAVDAHCSAYPGDECVPATSRSVVAKRVLRNVLLNNSDIMNFGLMGFSQGGPDGSTWDRNGDKIVDAADKDNWPDDYYFPYYPVQTTGGYETQDRYITVNELLRANCFASFAGPSASCTIGALTYQLQPNINARYSVYKNGSFVEIDQPYCGYICVITTIPQGWLLYGNDDDKRYQDARGTGYFKGAHYTFTVASGKYETFSQPVFRKQYEGRAITISGNPYTYFQPRNDYYWNPMAGTNRPPIKGAQCANQCGVTCGGNWDPQLIPIMDVSDNPVQAKANLGKMLPLLEKAEDGGFMHWERGPVGCALINDFLDGPIPAPNDKKKYSAWHYMQDIKAGDALVCRDNFILLITDGETNGPGDVDAAGKSTCANLDCRVQWDDPNATVGPTCQCKSVINALKLRKVVAQGGLNVKTYVIGFSPDAVIGVPATINESIARAGGTCRAPGDLATTADDKCMFLATNETELQESIQAVIFDAIKGSYSTTPASAVSGVQTEADEITPGGILFDARVDFPTWRGHLIAYDTQDIDAGTGQPKLMWDAGGPQYFPDSNDVFTYKNWTKWKKRRLYTSAGANMISFQIDPNTGKILNRDELFALGLGNTEDEAERIAQWMLGDPKQRNKAVLGAFVNSTPIELGPPGLSSLPGGKKFHEQQKDRTSLVYAAADDGLLHAFFTRDTTVGGVAHKGGEEAFAYIPPDMLRMVTTLYTQGGQKADPREHVYGLTSSPKVKNVCWTNCSDEETAQWKSIMVMTGGWGGTEAFMLDVTAPFAGNNFANPPVKVLWHTDTVTPGDKSQYDAFLGSTVSVPAFYYGKGASKNDHRVILASGYKTDPVTSSEQGITLVNASALDGRLLDSDTINPAGCSTVELAALTDVAAARNFDFREQQQMLGAFFGDTWGNLWRYVPGMQGADNNTADTGNLALVKAFGCQQPLHFSPAVVQPDRDDALNHPGEVYIVQVTNSALDPETEKFQPSRMIIRKEKRTTISGGLASDDTWITGGELELEAGANSMCGVFDPNGGGGGTCSQLIPAHARPTSTPLAILKGDGSGFVIMSLWYAPPLVVCGTGRSYLALHEININSRLAVQKAGIALVAEPVTSAVIVGEKVVYTDSQGKVHDVTSQLNQTFVAGGAISDTTRNGGLRFQQTGWTEVP